MMPDYQCHSEDVMVSRGGRPTWGPRPRWDAHMIGTDSINQVGCSIVFIILRSLNSLSDILQQAAPFPELCVTSNPGSDAWRCRADQVPGVTSHVVHTHRAKSSFRVTFKRDHSPISRIDKKLVWLSSTHLQRISEYYNLPQWRRRVLTLLSSASGAWASDMSILFLTKLPASMWSQSAVMLLMRLPGRRRILNTKNLASLHTPLSKRCFSIPASKRSGSPLAPTFMQDRLLVASKKVCMFSVRSHSAPT